MYDNFHQCEVSRNDLDSVKRYLEYEINQLKDELSRLRSDLETAQQVLIPHPVNENPPYEEWCPACDGCGWIEGGEYLMTNCPKCHGTGLLAQEEGDNRDRGR